MLNILKRMNFEFIVRASIEPIRQKGNHKPQCLFAFVNISIDFQPSASSSVYFLLLRPTLSLMNRSLIHTLFFRVCQLSASNRLSSAPFFFIATYRFFSFTVIESNGESRVMQWRARQHTSNVNRRLKCMIFSFYNFLHFNFCPLKLVE